MAVSKAVLKKAIIGVLQDTDDVDTLTVGKVKKLIAAQLKLTPNAVREHQQFIKKTFILQKSLLEDEDDDDDDDSDDGDHFDIPARNSSARANGGARGLSNSSLGDSDYVGPGLRENDLKQHFGIDSPVARRQRVPATQQQEFDQSLLNAVHESPKPTQRVSTPQSGGRGMHPALELRMRNSNATARPQTAPALEASALPSGIANEQDWQTRDERRRAEHSQAGSIFSSTYYKSLDGTLRRKHSAGPTREIDDVIKGVAEPQLSPHMASVKASFGRVGKANKTDHVKSLLETEVAEVPPVSGRSRAFSNARNQSSVQNLWEEPKGDAAPSPVRGRRRPAEPQRALRLGSADSEDLVYMDSSGHPIKSKRKSADYARVPMESGPGLRTARVQSSVPMKEMMQHSGENSRSPSPDKRTRASAAVRRKILEYVWDHRDDLVRMVIDFAYTNDRLPDRAAFRSLLQALGVPLSDSDVDVLLFSMGAAIQKRGNAADKSYGDPEEVVKRGVHGRALRLFLLEMAAERSHEGDILEAVTASSLEQFESEFSPETIDDDDDNLTLSDHGSVRFATLPVDHLSPEDASTLQRLRTEIQKSSHIIGGKSLYSIYKSMDANSDGRLSAPELLDGMEKVLGRELEHNECDVLLEALDPRHEGEIEFAVFAQWVDSVERQAAQEKPRRHRGAPHTMSHMKGAGVNMPNGAAGNSYISLHEPKSPQRKRIGRIVRAVAERLEQKGSRARESFASFDTDNDGIIDRSQFLSAMQLLCPRMHTVSDLNFLFDFYNKDDPVGDREGSGGEIDYRDFLEWVDSFDIVYGDDVKHSDLVESTGAYVPSWQRSSLSVQGLTPEKDVDSARNRRRDLAQGPKRYAKNEMDVRDRKLRQKIAEAVQLKRHNIRDVFSRFDVNRDGTLSYDEFKMGLKKLGADLMIPEQERLIRILDANNDRVIEYAEFATFIEEALAADGDTGLLDGDVSDDEDNFQGELDQSISQTSMSVASSERLLNRKRNARSHIRRDMTSSITPSQRHPQVLDSYRTGRRMYHQDLMKEFLENRDRSGASSTQRSPSSSGTSTTTIASDADHGRDVTHNDIYRAKVDRKLLEPLAENALRIMQDLRQSNMDHETVDLKRFCATLQRLGLISSASDRHRIWRLLLHTQAQNSSHTMSSKELFIDLSVATINNALKMMKEKQQRIAQAPTGASPFRPAALVDEEERAHAQHVQSEWGDYEKRLQEHTRRRIAGIALGVQDRSRNRRVDDATRYYHM